MRREPLLERKACQLAGEVDALGGDHWTTNGHELEQMKARAEQRRSNPLFAGQNEKIEALRRRIEHENAMYELERTQRAEAAKKKQEEEVRRQREKHDEIIAKREESERAKKEEEEKKRRETEEKKSATEERLERLEREAREKNEREEKENKEREERVVDEGVPAPSGERALTRLPRGDLG